MTKLPPGLIIDIGAGESPWKGWLPSGCSYRGIDIRHSSEFGMSQRGDQVTLYDGGVMPLDSNFFDGALCIEVLEHAEDPEFLLSEIARIMKSESVLLLTVPWSARRHHIPHDYHRFTKERLAVLLSNAGFTKISVTERGNDYCVIANKLTVNLIRNISQINLSNVFYRGPLIGITLILSLLMLAIAHISLIYESENSEDPLGYFCKAIKC
jgi:SAM-dependent methyltransferase